MQIEKCEAQRPIEKKMLIFVLFLMQQPEDAVKPKQLVEFRLSSRFQIAEQVMLSMTRTVALIIFVFRIFAQHQFDRIIRRFVIGGRGFEGGAGSFRGGARLVDGDSSGSMFVKYGELFACVYQSGAASSFFKCVPRGSMLHNSCTSFGFSRVKTIMPPSSAKIGPESRPELSFVNCRSSFPSSRYK